MKRLSALLAFVIAACSPGGAQDGAKKAAAPADEHPALSEMMTFSKGAYSISWDLPGAAEPPPSSPAPVIEPPPPSTPARKSIAELDELDVPDLDLFPQRYAPVRTVVFRAGVGMAIGMVSTWVGSWLNGRRYVRQGALLPRVQ